MNTKRLIALALSVSFLLGLSACNTDTGTETSMVSSVAETTRDVYAVADYDPENPITMETSPEYSDEALLGSWELVNGGVTETYTFATSNSGTYSITADSNSTDRGFTYNVVEGNIGRQSGQNVAAQEMEPVVLRAEDILSLPSISDKAPYISRQCDMLICE